MYFLKRHIFFLLLVCVFGCHEKMEPDEINQIGIVPCQHQPLFLASTGIDPKHAAFSTSAKRTRGLVLLETITANNGERKKWQDSSWTHYGYLGPISTDENGNLYVAPIPAINVLENHPEEQNTIYKVDSKTAIMKPLVDLGLLSKPTDENAFGILGLFYDCHAHLIYTGSVAGSTRLQENGIIYVVDPGDGKIIDRLTGVDAMGLCVGGFTGQKRLYYGSSRTADIYSIELTKSGKFTGVPRKEFSLDMLGPRGDDKARRIRFDQNGDLIVSGVEFNYNLTAPTERQETVYRFRYDDSAKTWQFIKIDS